MWKEAEIETSSNESSEFEDRSRQKAWPIDMNKNDVKNIGVNDVEKSLARLKKRIEER